MIQHYVHEGKAGISPVTPGYPGYIPRDVFFNMTGSFECFVHINQFNGKDKQNNKKLIALVIKNLDREAGIVPKKLLDKLLMETAMDIFATKGNNVEVQRTLWIQKIETMVR